MIETGPFPTSAALRDLEAAHAAGIELVPLHGTPSPGLPPHIVDTVSAALGSPMKAPPARGLLALREAVAVELARGTQRAVDPETDVLVTNGAMHALSICFRSLVQSGDEVIVPAPCFFFDRPIRSAGAMPVYVQGTASDGWRWDSEAIERAIGPRTRAVLLCNPGNPTGAVPSHEEVAAVVAVAETHDLLVVTDEAYEAALWEQATLTSASALAEDVVVIRSLGKSLSMPQLRVGIVCGPAARLARCAGTLEWDCLRVGLAAQEAALAGLVGPRSWLTRVKDTLAVDRAIAVAAVEATPGLSAKPPAAAPFLFIRADAGGNVAAGLLEVGLPVVDGAHFQAPGYARLPFGGAAEAAAPLRNALALWCERHSTSGSAR